METVPDDFEPFTEKVVSYFGQLKEDFRDFAGSLLPR